MERFDAAIILKNYLEVVKTVEIEYTCTEIVYSWFQMGFVYSAQVQNKSHTHSRLSLLPNLLLCFLAAICSWRSSKASASKWLPQGIITYNIKDVLNRNRNKPRSPVSTVPKKDIIILFTLLRSAKQPNLSTPEIMCIQFLLFCQPQDNFSK